MSQESSGALTHPILFQLRWGWGWLGLETSSRDLSFSLAVVSHSSFYSINVPYLSVFSSSSWSHRLHYSDFEGRRSVLDRKLCY